jgi:hypothetical protein
MHEAQNTACSVELPAQVAVEIAWASNLSCSFNYIEIKGLRDHHHQICSECKIALATWQTLNILIDDARMAVGVQRRNSERSLIRLWIAQVHTRSAFIWQTSMQRQRQRQDTIPKISKEFAKSFRGLSKLWYFTTVDNTSPQGQKKETGL